jgi:hypothetical protein
MLIQPSEPRTTNIPYRIQRLWNDSGRFTPSLGCVNCPDKATCGGLSVASPLFDCLHSCCQKPQGCESGCDAVCRNKPEDFVQRVREVGGFSLDNVPRAEALPVSELPRVVPVIFHGNKRLTRFAGASVVCLPMHKLVDARTGAVRFMSPEQLRNTFGIEMNTTITLERWWSFAARRVDAINSLKKLDVSLVTTPNYSLFTDQPRWDDLHSMKRIAIVHQEFLDAGMPAALHVNARTERDWERWGEYITGRPEITHLAFEFGTGAGWAGRIDWHADNLVRLSAAVGRQMHLIVRGGITILPRLLAGYDKVTCLETSVFVKTIHRKAAFLRNDGAVRWQHAPTKQDEPLDQLLNHNWNIVSLSYGNNRIASPVARKAA